MPCGQLRLRLHCAIKEKAINCSWGNKYLFGPCHSFPIQVSNSQTFLLPLERQLGGTATTFDNPSDLLLQNCIPPFFLSFHLVLHLRNCPPPPLLKLSSTSAAEFPIFHFRVHFTNSRCRRRLNTLTKSKPPAFRGH